MTNQEYSVRPILIGNSIRIKIRQALKKEIIDDMVNHIYNHSKNIVDINYNLHKVMHSKVYYGSIETIIKEAFKKRGVKGVLNVVSVLKGFLKTVSSKL